MKMKFVYGILLVAVAVPRLLFTKNPNNKKRVLWIIQIRKRTRSIRTLTLRKWPWQTKSGKPVARYLLCGRDKGEQKGPGQVPLKKFEGSGNLLLCRMWQCTFKSDTKFESGCGWPSFYEPISKGSIIYAPDNSYGMNRNGSYV